MANNTTNRTTSEDEHNNLYEFNAQPSESVNEKTGKGGSARAESDALRGKRKAQGTSVPIARSKCQFSGEPDGSHLADMYVSDTDSDKSYGGRKPCIRKFSKSNKQDRYWNFRATG